jgi:DNA-nicking Smr family endonuclease
VQKVRWFLERWERQRPGAVLEIVTGRGNRSAGAPVLKAAIEDALRGELADRVARWVVQPGGGAVLLELNG